MSEPGPPFISALLAGGIAGTTVDLSLFPLDTLKTRLQAGPGQFWKSGGFRGVYQGVGSAVVGSAPGAALFFVTYESVKKRLPQHPYSHMFAGSLGEIAACAVRVPTEVIKQRTQTGQFTSSAKALTSLIRESVARGGIGQMVRELYRGAGVTIMREVPFTVVQFPLWETMRKSARDRRGATENTALESAICGSVAGGISAAATTPLDVLKTRIMISTEP